RGSPSTSRQGSAGIARGASPPEAWSRLSGSCADRRPVAGGRQRGRSPDRAFRGWHAPLPYAQGGAHFTLVGPVVPELCGRTGPPSGGAVARHDRSLLEPRVLRRAPRISDPVGPGELLDPNERSTRARAAAQAAVAVPPGKRRRPDFRTRGPVRSRAARSALARGRLDFHQE